MSAKRSRRTMSTSCERLSSGAPKKKCKINKIENVKSCRLQNTDEPFDSTSDGIDFIFPPAERKMRSTKWWSSDERNFKDVLTSSTDESPDSSWASFRHSLKVMRRGENFSGRIFPKSRPGRIPRSRRFMNKCQPTDLHKSGSTGWDNDEVTSPSSFPIYPFKSTQNSSQKINYQPPTNACISFSLSRGGFTVQNEKQSKNQNPASEAELYRKKLRTLYMCSYKHSRKSFTNDSDVIMRSFGSDAVTDVSVIKDCDRSMPTAESYCGDGEESYKADIEATEKCLQWRKLVSNVDRLEATSRAKEGRVEETEQQECCCKDSLESIAGIRSTVRSSLKTPEGSQRAATPNNTSSNTCITLWNLTSDLCAGTSFTNTTTATHAKSTTDFAAPKEASKPQLVLHPLHACGNRPRWPFLNKRKELEVTCKSDGDLIFLFDSDHWDKSTITKFKPRICERRSKSKIPTKTRLSLKYDTSNTTQLSLDTDSVQFAPGKVVHVPIITYDIRSKIRSGSANTEQQLPPISLGDVRNDDGCTQGALNSLNKSCLRAASARVRRHACGLSRTGVSQCKLGKRTSQNRGFDYNGSTLLRKQHSTYPESHASNNNLLSIGYNRCYDLSRGLSKSGISGGKVVNNRNDGGRKESDISCAGSRIRTYDGYSTERIDATRRTKIILPCGGSSQKTISKVFTNISSSDEGTASGNMSIKDVDGDEKATSIQGTRGTDRSECGLRMLEASCDAEEQSDTRFACSTIIISKTDIRNESLLPAHEPLLLGHLRSGVMKKAPKKTHELEPWLPIY